MKSRLRLLALLVVATAVASCSPAQQAAPAAEETPSPDATTAPETSLYERLGGEDAIAAVVDEFIDVLSSDDVLNANPAIKEARDRAHPDELKAKVTALVCQVTGGPQEYTGRPMKESHADMNISGTEWDQMVEDFIMVLDGFNVPAKEQGELLEIIGSTKADIVTRPNE